MRPYILKGKVEEDFSSITLTVTWIGFLDKYKRTGIKKSQQMCKKVISA
jgi:hypothetical protein